MAGMVIAHVGEISSVEVEAKLVVDVLWSIPGGVTESSR